MGRLRCVIEPGPVISGDLARQMAHAWHGFAGLAVWWVLLAALGWCTVGPGLLVAFDLTGAAFSVGMCWGLSGLAVRVGVRWRWSWTRSR